MIGEVVRSNVGMRVSDDEWPDVKRALDRYFVPALSLIGVTVDVEPLSIHSNLAYGNTAVGDVLTSDYRVTLTRK